MTFCALSSAKGMDIRMKMMDFCHNLKLPEKAAESAVNHAISEKQYQNLKHLYQKEHQQFYQRILKGLEPEKVFLSFYCRLACDTYEEYKIRKIDEQIFWDTFQDIRLWCDNCFRETGKYGIAEYQWFWRLFEMKVFRLGRLEFEIMNAEKQIKGNGISIEAGEPIINIHIPEGEALSRTACGESLKRAHEWFGAKQKFICYSWLLYPGLNEILAAESNIIHFQNRFHLIKTDYQEREAEKRIFGWIAENITAYPDHTRLQKRARQYLLSGRALGKGWGLLK